MSIIGKLANAIASPFRRRPVVAGYLPEPQPVELKPAPSTIEVVTKPWAGADYGESGIGYRLTPDGVAYVLRQADAGRPALMYDAFENIVLNDGHTRGLFEQRMDEISGVDWTLRPGDDRPNSKLAAENLAQDLIDHDVDVDGWIEHTHLQSFYGCSYSEVGWITSNRGRQTVGGFAHVPHRRFAFDDQDRPLLTSQENPRGDLLKTTSASSWTRAETRRWRKKAQAGILRTALWWCVFKRMSVRDWLIFSEKYGIPFITGHYDENAGPETRKALIKTIEMLGTEGRAVMSEGARIVIHDSVLRSGGGDHLHSQMVTLCNSEISKVITAGTLTADTSGPGSFALGQVHADSKHKLSLADARRVGRTWRRGVGSPYVRRNGILDAAPPVLHLQVQKASLLEDARTLQILSSSGLPISISQTREYFGQRPPRGDDDTMQPSTTNEASTTNQTNEP